MLPGKSKVRNLAHLALWPGGAEYDVLLSFATTPQACHSRFFGPKLFSIAIYKGLFINDHLLLPLIVLFFARGQMEQAHIAKNNCLTHLSPSEAQVHLLLNKAMKEENSEWADSSNTWGSSIKDYLANECNITAWKWDDLGRMLINFLSPQSLEPPLLH